MSHAAVIQLGERLDHASVQEVLQPLERALARRATPIVVDLGRVEAFDSTGLGAVLEGMRRARARGIEVKLRGLSPPMLELFSLVSVERLLAPPPPPPGLDPIARTGAMFEPLWHAAAGVGRVALETLHAIAVAPWRGRGHGLRLDRTAIEMDHAANGALAITALISFLLGLVLAMQAWVQLRVWGAEIYMADMVGVSVTSEIGPLMTAIILAARSGGSNAAQLGAMTIGEEIDALVQMGVHPIRFLVAPKVLALAFAAVALGCLFEATAICGGALFALGIAGIDPGAYLAQTQQAVHLGEFLVGMVKCLLFGASVGVIGCALGLRVAGGSAGVARATTNAVVVSIFVVIVMDAAFVTAQRLLPST